MLKGFVVACPPQRRPDGSSGFEVSLLMAEPLSQTHAAPASTSTMSWFEPLLHGRRCLGLN